MSSNVALDPSVGVREVLRAAGGFGLGGLAEVRVTPSRSPGILAAPRSAHVTGDGRALAWFGEGRACVVHPTLDELCQLHGVEVEATLAA